MTGRTLKLVNGYWYRQMPAPTTRGYVRYINVRPDYLRGQWVCDECLTRVRPSRFGSHAEQHP